ncbi:transcriptional regulator [Clostridioides difficile]|nr:transcriptional regulator [Clostridioides difficile]
MKINNNLKLQREKIGLTQLEVAQKAKITERSYQYYEAGERLPNIRTALKNS